MLILDNSVKATQNNLVINKNKKLNKGIHFEKKWFHSVLSI